ncbi:MAG: diacylglycerol/lipid kinase family protein [Myxococcales bacterium]
MHGNVERLPIPQKKVAVLLNGNARAVTEQLRRELEQFVPPEDLFFSRTFEDARSIARTVLDRGYPTVLTGGGDGTFVGYVNCLFDEVAREQPHLFVRASGGSAAAVAPRHTSRMPRFGVLRLGTGNALAEFAGASARRLGVVEDILRTRSGEVSRARALHLLHCEGKRAPFAGLGLDARILNDYVAVKKGAAGIGKAGYFWAVATRTIPAVLAERTVPMVEVVNVGSAARKLDWNGRPVGREIRRGELLYRGPCRIAAAGTVPCYGFGFRIFPFALRSPGQFQLRLSSMTVAQTLAQAPRIWKGITPRKGVADFLCDRVHVKFDREMPFQIGGDAEGYRKELELSMCDQPLELLDFNCGPLLQAHRPFATA